MSGVTDLWFATGNAHKVAEMQAMARGSGLPLRLRGAREAGGMPPVAEDTGTFVGNARQKARALAAVLGPGHWVLADDSGLCVDALGGHPGVESAHYAGPGATDEDNLRRLLREMEGVPTWARSAHFRCVLVLLDPAGAERLFEGRCDGTLRTEPAGAAGFGYDPVFVPSGHDRTLAELGEAVKNPISHRGRAWRELAEWWRARSA